VTKSSTLQYPEEKQGFSIPWGTETDRNTSFNKGNGGTTPPYKESDTPPEDEEKGIDEIVESDSPPSQPQPSDGFHDLMKKDTEVDHHERSSINTSRRSSAAAQLSHVMSREQTRPWSIERFETEKADAVNRQLSTIIEPQKTKDGIIVVDW
jgi:2,3-bisphosphoglycerate-independent phosphoglycerate mutase